MSDTAKRLIKGSALRVITLLSTMGVSFFMMPFIIRSLGNESYGLWVLIGSVLSFYSLLDLGISNATQRFIAFALPSNDDDQLNEVINTSLFIYLIISAIAIIITLTVVALSPFFSDQIVEVAVFQKVIVIMGLTMALNFPFMVVNGILSAKLRYDISSYILLLKLVIRTLLMLYFLSNGYSLIAMAIITAFVDLSGNLITVYQAKRLAPQIQFSSRFYSKKRLPELINYAKYTFLSMTSDAFRQNADNFIITAYLSLSSVTMFAIAAQLTTYFKNLISSAIAVMLPLFTKYIATNDYAALKTNFLLVTRIGVFLTTTVAGGLLIFGDTFIELWLGDDYNPAYIPLIILVISTAYEAIQYPSVNLLFALSKHNVYAYIGIIEGIANVILSLLLVKEYGIIGIAIGTAIPMLITRLFILPFYTTRFIDLSFRQYALKLITLQSVLVILQIPIFLIDQALMIQNFAQLIAMGTLSYALYLIVAANLLLRPEEVEMLYTRFPGSRKFIFRHAPNN